MKYFIIIIFIKIFIIENRFPNPLTSLAMIAITLLNENTPFSNIENGNIFADKIIYNEDNFNLTNGFLQEIDTDIVKRSFIELDDYIKQTSNSGCDYYISCYGPDEIFLNPVKIYNLFIGI